MLIDYNTIGWIIIAAINLFTAVITFRTNQLTKQTELNTNSMREQLVDATAKFQHGKGLEEGRAEGIAKAALIAEGVEQGKQKGI